MGACAGVCGQCSSDQINVFVSVFQNITKVEPLQGWRPGVWGHVLVCVVSVHLIRLMSLFLCFRI